MNPNVTIDRHKYIGGSDLPSILGLNAKYGKNVFDFAKEKAGVIPNTFTGNQFTKYGQVLEPIIRDFINSVHEANYVEDTIIDEQRHYRGNTDGIDRNAAIPIIEIKTFGDTLDIDYYEPQCQFYMETFNVDAVLLVGYKRPSNFYSGVDYNLENDDSFFNFEFDENRLEQHVIHRNKELWNKIENRITAFQEAVTLIKEGRIQTETDFNSTFYGVDLITKSAEIIRLENQLVDFKKIEADYKKMKEDLYKLFDERGILSFDTGVVKITKVAPTSYETVSIDSAKLESELPDIYEKYKVRKTTNKKGYILITQKKEEK